MKWKTYVAALAALATIVVAAVLLWPGEPEESDVPEPVTDRVPTSTTEETERPARPATRRGRPGETKVAASEPEQDQRDRGETRDEARRAAPGDRRDDETATRAEETAVEDGPPLEISDMGGDVAVEDNRPWKDPTNQRVLGDKRWMAPISKAEEERIDEVFEKAREARKDPSLSNFDRRLSIEAARESVDECFEQLRARQPSATGRLIVAWKTGAAMGTGWIRSPRIVTNVGLEEPQFERCVVEGLEGTSFSADDGDPIQVEYPFFYER